MNLEAPSAAAMQVMSPTPEGLRTGGGSQTVFDNLPATVESMRGEPGSFEVEVSGIEGASSSLEVVSNGCGFDVEIDAAGVVSWECGSDQPAECDVSIGLSDGSADATLSLVCANRVPEVSEVAVSPSTPSLISEIRCEYDFSDGDADSEQSQIEWIRGGEPAGSGAIYAGKRAPGDVISCNVTPDDGWDVGTVVESDEVTINEATARSLGDFVQGSPKLHGVDYATRLGDAVYFRASHESLGFELWRLDLTTHSIELVRDFMDGPGSGLRGPMQVVGSTLYFAANDGVHGTELWSIDETTQSAVMVADTLAGIESGEAAHLTEFDQTLYYVTREDGGNASALWRLDPTTGQPVSVRSRIGGTPALDDGVEFAGALYFPGGTGRGDLLRLSPSQGVSQLPTTASGADVGNVVATAQAVYFTKGRTLWRTDGTSSGTETMSGFLEVVDLLVYQDELYIVELSSPGSGYEYTLSRYSDTDSDPPTLLGSFATDSALLHAQFLGQNANGVIFKVPHPTENSHELWVTDGTSAGTTSLVDDVYIDQVTRDGDVLYFAGRPSSHTRYGLWRTDGTSAGTERVTGTGYGMGSYGPKLSAAAGTVLLDPGERSLPSELMLPGTDTLSLLTVDGMDLGSYPQEVAVMGQDAVISMRDGFVGYSLQYFDHASDSVRQIEHDQLGPALALGEAATQLTNVGDRVYFNGGTDDRKYLWWTDGTDDGTAYLVRTAGGNRPEKPHSLVALGDKVIFAGYDPGIAWEPWVSDGTTDGSLLLANIAQNINAGSDPDDFLRVGDQVYFLAEGSSWEQALWVTDGTASGTQMISSDHNFRSLREVDGSLYVRVSGSSTSTIGRYQPDTGDFTWLPELPDNNDAGQWAAAGGTVFVANDRQDELVWRLDGDAYTLIDGEPYAGNRISGLVGAKDRVFWVHKEDGMWSVRSADTTSSEATVIVDQLHAEPSGMRVLDGRILFETLDGGVSRLFISDGTPEGTAVLLNATSELKNIQPLARSTTGIFVSAYTSDHGQELWLIE